MEKQTQNLNENTISNTIINTFKYAGTSVFTFIFEQYLNVLNSFLSSVQNQLTEILPKNSPVMDKYKQALLVQNAINEVFNDPIFKAQIQAFSDNLKNTIQPFLTEMNDLLKREGDNLADSAFKIGNRVARNTVAGVLEGVEGALTLFPGVGTIIDTLNVLQGFIDSASVLSVEFLSNMSKVMSAFLKVYGETSGPIVDTIKSIEELFNSIKNIQERVNQKIDAINSSVNQIQNIKGPNIGGRKNTLKKLKTK